MRERTAALHSEAERSGIVAALFRGQATRTAYALYLRNLLPVYRTIENALPQSPDLDQPGLYRSARIEADLQDLAGRDWATALPILPSAETYAARIATAAGTPTLIAHCYTRYLGDLNGGQILARRLNILFGPDFTALRFTEFPAAATQRAAYRDQLDRAGRCLADLTPVIEEAAIAFQLNITLSVEIEKNASEAN
jgi:heme oxygenase